jgi:hypothetical protein
MQLAIALGKRPSRWITGDRMTRLAVLLLAVVASSCGPTDTKLAVSSAGTFSCGMGLHGCIAWFVVRPTNWTRPANWEPGKNDGQFPTTSDNHGTFVVEGAPTGGPSVLQPGEYRFSLLYSEGDDTKPYVLGTDEQPTTGLYKTTFECDAIYVVDRAVAILDVNARFGNDCAIDFTPRG